MYVHSSKSYRLTDIHTDIQTRSESYTTPLRGWSVIILLSFSRVFVAGSEQVGRQIHRSCSLESVRVSSPRDFRGGDDVIGEKVLVPAAMRRTRGCNESFRAAVDRSYTKRQAAALGERHVRFVLAPHLHLYVRLHVLHQCNGRPNVKCRRKDPLSPVCNSQCLLAAK